MWDGLRGPHVGEVELVGGLQWCWQKTMILLETRAVEVRYLGNKIKGLWYRIGMRKAPRLLTSTLWGGGCCVLRWVGPQ